MSELLPAIFEHTKLRPGKYQGFVTHLVPDETKLEFWGAFYETLNERFSLNLPFADADKKVNQYLGYFGKRFHPKNKTPDYFHVGLDIDGALKAKIFPITRGVLEYSGFGIIDGKYVMISHPEIKTEDGFTLHSLYLHLRDLKVSFTSYQKMLREISFNTYPRIEISAETQIGVMGQTGNAHGHPHLHLQLEFRNEKGDIVLIDPLQSLGFAPGESLTKDIKDISSYEAFLDKHRDDMLKTNLAEFMKNDKG